MNNGTLIIGGSVAGLQAALDLANSGIPVHLTTSQPFLDHQSGQDIPKHWINARSLDVLRHPLIKIWNNSDIHELEQNESGFRANLRRTPRFVDLERCIACGDCIDVCPVTIPGTERKAIYLDGQPGCMAIDRAGKAPCSGTCPGGIHVQGYVALIAEKRYREAIELIFEALPFPSVCGRVCNHYCESNCTRGKIDESLNIMALKRFVADWAYDHKDAIHFPEDNPNPTHKKIAIIGAGPSGLTAARDLARIGHEVRVYDSLPAAGGMMRYGIPPHRLPTEQLDWEIQQIVDEGVELVLNTRVDDIPGLIENGYDAVLIATGAHKAKKIPIKNSDHPDNWLSLDLLRRARMGDEIDLLGKKVVVLGGGNVALDSVRTAIRLGAAEVCMTCLEPRGEMPGFEWEIGVAEEEGVEVYPGRTFKEIVVEKDKIIGVRCVEIDFRGFQDGRPDFEEIPNSEHILPADLVIWAIGQEPDYSFLPSDDSIETQPPLGIYSDGNMMSSMPGVFVSGDVRRGKTFYVIDAIGEGHQTARCIDRYLRGEEGMPEPVLHPKVEYNAEESEIRFEQSMAGRQARAQIPAIPLKERIRNFKEVDLPLSEEDAVKEANRCLLCGPCSECLACVDVCKTGAIDHNKLETQHSLQFNAVIYADPEAVFEDLSIPASQGMYRISSDDPLLGSSVAAQAMLDSASNRQSLPISMAPEVTETPTRIGVFVCQCGDPAESGKISSIVNIQMIADQATSQPDVIHTQVLPFSCTPEAAQEIQTAIDGQGLERVVLAACSCCNIDQVCLSCTYQRVRCKENQGLFLTANGLSGLSPIPHLAPQSTLFEFVNIREQCAWVHQDNPQRATEKAISLVTATITRAKAAPAKLAGARSLEKSALILGNGPSGPHCQNMLAELNVDVETIALTPTQVSRAGGLYIVHHHEQTWKASTIVLAPTDQAQFEKMLAAFGRQRRQPQIDKSWGGLDTHRPGVYFIDPNLDAHIAGAAAAARVMAWIGRTESRPPTAAVVDLDRCRACETCIDTCEYCAPELIEIDGRYTSWIDPAICVSCGTCAAHCPSGAIFAGCSTDTQLEAMLDAILT